MALLPAAFRRYSTADFLQLFSAQLPQVFNFGSSVIRGGDAKTPASAPNAKASLPTLPTLSHNLATFEPPALPYADSSVWKWMPRKSQTSISATNPIQPLRFAAATAVHCYHYSNKQQARLDLAESADNSEGSEALLVSNGDDAIYTSARLLGIADGVSGWSSRPDGDSALWARLFLGKTARYVQQDGARKPRAVPADLGGFKLAFDLASKDAQAAMRSRHLQGSSTGLVVHLAEQNCLQIGSIGDSRLFIFRKESETEAEAEGTYRLVYHNSEQYLDTNQTCPVQVGTALTDAPSNVGTFGLFRLQRGDVLVLCSDGLSDNLWPSEIAMAVNNAMTRGVHAVAAQLLHDAQQVMYDEYACTPYYHKMSELERQQGRMMTGGKVDDVSICVAEAGV